MLRDAGRLAEAQDYMRCYDRYFLPSSQELLEENIGFDTDGSKSEDPDSGWGPLGPPKASQVDEDFGSGEGSDW